MPVSKGAYRKKRTAIESEETRQKKAVAGRSSKGGGVFDEVKRNKSREEKLAARIEMVVAKAKAIELASASTEEIDINGENVFRNRFVLSRRSRVRALKLG